MAAIKDPLEVLIRKAIELGCKILEGDEWIAQDVDILLPCALENQLTPETLEKLAILLR